MALSRKVGEHTLPKGLLRLHVSLGWVDTEEQEQILKQYGGVKRGKTITRDIIVPDDMPLRALHFTLQRAFGFQESHLHRFELFSEDLLGVTGDTMENLLNLRGVIFSDAREDGMDFFEPMYDGGSFKKWLRKQYTGPYAYDGDWLENYHSLDGMDDDYSEYDDSHFSADDVYYKLTKIHQGKDDKPDFTSYFQPSVVPAFMIDELEGTGKYVRLADDPTEKWRKTLVRCNADHPDAQEVIKVRFGDLKLQDGLRVPYGSITDIIARLPIKCVLAPSSDYLPFDENYKEIHSVTGLKHPQIVTDEEIQKALKKNKDILPKPFTSFFSYIYDFGDNWHFYISGSKGCSDLVETGVITKEELEAATKKALKEYHPVLIAKDGDMLIEDCGNVDGFVRFLKHMRLDPDTVISETNDDEYDDDEYDDDEDEEVDDDLDALFESFEDDDEDDVDDNGMTRTELLEWALSQGWHKNDTANIDLL